MGEVGDGRLGSTCRHCGWDDPDYDPPPAREWSAEERERRLAEPCTLTSDLSTFMSPADLLTPEEG